MGIGMVGPTIMAPERQQRHRYLRPIFTAEEIWCQLFSEPSAGSDVATLSTGQSETARSGSSMDRKCGRQLRTSRTLACSYARTDPDVPSMLGITAFILDMASPGVDVRPLRQMNGESEFNEVFLTDARVSDASRIGGPGDGWNVAVTTLMNERVSIGGVVEPAALATSGLCWNSGATRVRTRPPETGSYDAGARRKWCGSET